ncbi:LGFP repeat-containing protein [Nocardia takedensis]
MHHFARRTAGLSSAALLSAGLLLTAGCGDDDNSGSNALSSVSSAILGSTTAASPTPTTAGTGTGTTTPETTSPGATTTGEEAGEQTEIATPSGAEVTVSGDIYDKYVASGGPTGPLGAPEEAEENGPANGKYQDFVGGTIYEPEEGEPHIVWGEIREAWEANGGASGKLGYPTSDETDIPGGKQSTFTGGTITWVDGKITVTPTS